jgi:hypothetical protein
MTKYEYNYKRKNDLGIVLLIFVLTLVSVGIGKQKDGLKVKAVTENPPVQVVERVVEKQVYVKTEYDQDNTADVIAYITKSFEPYGKKAVAQAIAISYLESKWTSGATNENWKNGKVVSTDRGFWQFNDKAHPEISEECARDLECSTDQAVKHYIESGESFSPWVASKVTNLYW